MLISLVLNTVVQYSVKTMDQSNCFWLQVIPMFGACVGSPFILCLGLDRFAAVKLPSRLVVCSIPQSYGVVAFDLLNQIGIAVNVAIVVVYALTFYVLRRSGARSEELIEPVFKAFAENKSAHTNDKVVRNSIANYKP
ncbi:hypothetical protein COOONC_03503 [Cooperia oncophora]